MSFNRLLDRSRSFAEAEKRRKQLRAENPIHILRVLAEIRQKEFFGSQSQVVGVRILLNDFFPKGVIFYSPVPLTENAQIDLTLNTPIKSFIHGSVIHCAPALERSNILSSLNFKFKVMMRFDFHSDIDRRDIGNLYLEIKELIQPNFKLDRASKAAT